MPPIKLPLPLNSLCALILTGLSGLMVAGLKPMLVTLYITQFGYSTQVTGNILTAEMLSATVGAGAVAFLIKRIGRRNLARISLVLLLISDLTSMLPFGLGWLVSSRLVAGFSEGLAVSTMAATITGLSEPERLIGIYNTLSMLVFASAFVVAPLLASAWGMKAVFLALALMTVIPLALNRSFPNAVQDSAARGQGPTAPVPLVRATLILLGTTAFYFAWGGLWPFVGEIGRHAGLSTSEVGVVLSVSQLAGAGGSIITAIAGKRYGRALPIFICIGGTSLSVVALLATGVSVVAYTWAIPLFMGCAMMFLGYLMGLVAEVDAMGRVAGLVFAIQTIGLGIGPSWGAALISRHGYSSVLWVSVALIPLTILFLGPLLWINRGGKREAATQSTVLAGDA